jgi:L-amino acid N-acyltransferase YncA
MTGPLERARYEARGAQFLLSNVWRSKGLRPLPPAPHGTYVIRGLRPSDLAGVRRLHRQLRDGQDLNLWRRATYRLRGPALVVVVVDHRKEVLGFAMYYFREEEGARRIVHCAFVGVCVAARGQGLATAMHDLAGRHFVEQGLGGISAQVESTNRASLRSFLNVGFSVCGERTGPHGERLLQMFRDLSRG